MRILFPHFCLSLLFLPVLGLAQDVLSIKGRRAIIGYNSAQHIIQIGQEYSTMRTPGAIVQIQEIGERFILANLVEGRLREDDQIDFSLASRLKDEDRPPYRPHHLSLGLGVTNNAAMVISGEQLFEAASTSGIVFSYRYQREGKWDFGFRLLRQSGTTLIGDDLLSYYRKDPLIASVEEEFESSLQRTMVTARRDLWGSTFLDLGLGVTTYTLESFYFDSSGREQMMKSTFRGVDVQASLGYLVKFQHRYFLEASVGASFSALGSTNIANPNNRTDLEFEGSAKAFNTGYLIKAGFCF